MRYQIGMALVSLTHTTQSLAISFVTEAERFVSRNFTSIKYICLIRNELN